MEVGDIDGIYDVDVIGDEGVFVEVEDLVVKM